MTSVRQATASDLATFPSFDPATSTDRQAFLERLLGESGGCLLVAIDDDQPASPVVGYVAMSREAFYGRDVIDLLIVRKSYRRHGIGRTLLTRATAEARTATVFTSTNESNAAMQALLAGEGWTLSGRLTGLDEGDPELVYYREP